MYKFFIITIIAAVPLMADFFPPTTQSTIASVGKKSVTLSTPLPVEGMSGIVMHNYGSGLEAATAYAIQRAGKNITIKKEQIVNHDKLPAIKTAIESGDKVIGGYLYDNVLLLAPDANTYAKITSRYQKHWIHPDLYAVFLSSEGKDLPTKENLAEFAKEYEVGLIYIVKKNKAVLLDPVSGAHVAEKNISATPSKGKFPFFMRLDGIESGWFGGKSKGNYYQLVEAL